MFDDIHDLYQELILDHNAHPHHFGKLENATHFAKGHNPLCGDDVEIFLEIEDERIKDICFLGQGCAISKSSASIMTDEVIGKTLEEAKQIFRFFHLMLTTEDDLIDKNILGKSSVFAGVKQFPMRVKCATLAWHTFVAALDGDSHSVTTE